MCCAGNGSAVRTVTATIGSVCLYTAGLLSLQTGGLLNVSVLNFGSGPLSATIVNDDEVLDQASDGVATAAIDGGPALPPEYIGKGTAQTFTLLGLPLLAVPAVAFKAGDQVFVHFPNGPPLLSGLLIGFGLNPGLGFALPDPMPICPGAGARVATPNGPVPVEQLRPGDRVLTPPAGRCRCCGWARAGWNLMHSRASPGCARCAIRPEAGQPAATRAVTSISNRMASSISRASIMVAAGRAVPKAAESCGQSRGNSARSGRM